MTQEQVLQEFHDKVAQVASLAVTYSKTGTGYTEMCNAFNGLCDMSGADRGIDLDCTIARRKLIVQSVCIRCIPSLSSAENNQLEAKLKEIAEDYPERRTISRMRR